MFEIIVETVNDARAAEAGGATQLDLKCDFFENGLTPTAGTVERIFQNVDIDVIVMVRTYANGFVLSPDDVAIMCADIGLSRERGAAGFLLGALTSGGKIDREAVHAFQDAAGDLPIHFHLAWEMTKDPGAALDELIELDVQSVRTTGGQGLGGRAVDGIEAIRMFREQADGRIEFLLAGGVNHENVGKLVRTTGVLHAHAGSSVRTPPNTKGAVTEEKVRALRAAYDEAIASLKD
jgi:copper homeostasis protein